MTGHGGFSWRTATLAVGLAAALVLASGSALAQTKRVGGGKNVGETPSSRVVDKERKAEPAPAPVAQPGPPAREPEPVQRTVAGPDDRPMGSSQGPRGWTGMLGGMAAGLGIAAAVHAMGLNGAVADLVTGALIVSVLLGLGLLTWRLVRHTPSLAANPAGRGSGPKRATRSSFSASEYEAASLAPESSVHYGPETLTQESASSGRYRWGVPAGFDSEGFVQQALRHFVILQQAWDAADIARLANLMTDELLVNIRLQLQERGDKPNRTDVVTLDAELLGVEGVDDQYVASVEFSGMIREEVSAGATPFREVWSLTKPQDGSSGWLLAGVQALH